MRLAVRIVLCAFLAVATLGACDSDDDERIEGTLPGDCEDGADNDADGLFDCDDDSCAGAPACKVPDAGVITFVDAQ